MGKPRKLSEKELEEAHEMFDSKKGTRTIMFCKDGKFYPFCILCGKIIESGSFLRGMWVEPEFERVYTYAICLDHGSNPLSDEKVIREIEERLMVLVASGIPRRKIEKGAKI